ncbi:MAG: GGDEF domain-containing protein [Pseudomonadota bacterium]
MTDEHAIPGEADPPGEPGGDGAPWAADRPSAWVSRCLGDPLRWSLVTRAMAILALAIPFLLLAIAESTWFHQHPWQAPYLDQTVLIPYRRGAIGLAALGQALLAAGLGLRHRRPRSRLYAWLAVGWAYLVPLLIGHYFGFHVNGILLGVVSVGVLTLVLLPERIAVGGILAAISAITTHEILVQTGRIPHAPIMCQPPYAEGPLHWSFFWGTGIALDMASLVVLSVVWLMARAQRAQAVALERLAVTDPLTGVANRRHFMLALAREVERARRYRHPLGLVMMDIDHFKQVNDTLGHAVGDVVLQEVVARMAAQVRRVDLVARWGGEEFVILLPHLDLEQTRLTAERLRQAIAASPVAAEGHAVRVTASFGVTVLARSATDDAGEPAAPGG